jgi:predicted ATPase/DNA-binding SARP family transcriptional activator
MTTFDIRLFGAIEIRRNGELLTNFRSQKALVLLAYLIVENRPVTRDYLAGLAWPEMEQGPALGLLRRSLHDLNSQLPGCLAIDRRTVRFSPTAPATIDLHTLASLLASPDLEGWTTAAHLYGAPFLHGIYVDGAPELENWLLREQERWQGELVRLLNRLATYHRKQADYQQALAYTQQLLAVEPWREDAHRQVMLLLARLGQTSAALAQYERCCQTLRAELDVEPARETNSLRTRIAALAHLPAQPLPPATTPFIGRAEEVTELTQLLTTPACRLITLLGPGGMGKTRLALEVARTVVTEQRQIFLHGVVFVPLVGVETLPQTVAALGQALAFPFQSQGAPETQLLHYLRDKELLLVLDNVEQLVSQPILAFVRQLLDSASDLKLLVTSRVRLNLQAEQLYWMQGLSVPPTATTATPPVADMATYSSVQLFLSTVQRSRPHYTLATADVPAVVAICQLVQGMPLALELAATWMSVLTPTEITAELTHSLDFLASDLHDLPLRQRSMRAVFATSWRLLTPGEQQIFAQLAVFQGSFTREAAQAVTGVSLPVLIGLIHKSFLQQTSDGRYQIHELLRQFGEEKLAETPTRQTATHDRHSDYYLTFVNKRAAGLQGPQQPVLLHEISQEIDNIRHGWLWAAEQGNADLIDWALDGLYGYYQMRSRCEEGIELFTHSFLVQHRAASTVLPHQIANRLQARQGALCCEFGHYEQARTLLQASLSVARSMDDKKEIAFCLDFIGKTVWWQESGLAALPFLEESLFICRAIGDQVGIASTLDNLAAVYDMSSEFPHAWQFAHEGLTISCAIGHTAKTASILRRLGSTAVGLGKYDIAISYYQESAAKFRQVDDNYGLVQALAELGRAMYGSRNYPRDIFIGVLEEAATLARKLGQDVPLYYAIGILGNVSNWIGEYETGKHCGQELGEIVQQMPPSLFAGYHCLLGEAEVGLGNLHLARQRLLEAMTLMLKTETRLVTRQFQRK